MISNNQFVDINTSNTDTGDLAVSISIDKMASSHIWPFVSTGDYKVFLRVEYNDCGVHKKVCELMPDQSIQVGSKRDGRFEISVAVIPTKAWMENDMIKDGFLVCDNYQKKFCVDVNGNISLYVDMIGEDITWEESTLEAIFDDEQKDESSCMVNHETVISAGRIYNKYIAMSMANMADVIASRSERYGDVSKDLLHIKTIISDGIFLLKECIDEMDFDAAEYIVDSLWDLSLNFKTEEYVHKTSFIFKK